MSDEERRLFRDEGVVPAGWRWCPDCNGEGIVTVMLASPDMEEVAHDCVRCQAERGIVPNDL